MNNPLMSTPTRIALAGDWHGFEDDACAAIHAAHEAVCEGIVQLGDFGIWPGEEGTYFLDGVQEALQRTGMWCMFIDGNHEDFWQLYAIPLDEDGLRLVRPGLWHLPRGTRWEWAGKIWLAMGGATSLDRGNRKIGVNWWPEESITLPELERAAEGGRVDVMLTHDCPAGVEIPHLSNNWSRRGLQRAKRHREILLSLVEVVRPSQLWHGHFHIRYRAVATFARVPCVVNGLGKGSDRRESLVIIDPNIHV